MDRALALPLPPRTCRPDPGPHRKSRRGKDRARRHALLPLEGPLRRRNGYAPALDAPPASPASTLAAAWRQPRRQPPPPHGAPEAGLKPPAGTPKPIAQGHVSGRGFGRPPRNQRETRRRLTGELPLVRHRNLPKPVSHCQRVSRKRLSLSRAVLREAVRRDHHASFDRASRLRQ